MIFPIVRTNATTIVRFQKSATNPLGTMNFENSDQWRSIAINGRTIAKKLL